MSESPNGRGRGRGRGGNGSNFGRGGRPFERRKFDDDKPEKKSKYTEKDNDYHSHHINDGATNPSEGREKHKRNSQFDNPKKEFKSRESDHMTDNERPKFNRGRNRKEGEREGSEYSRKEFRENRSKKFNSGHDSHYSRDSDDRQKKIIDIKMDNDIIKALSAKYGNSNELNVAAKIIFYILQDDGIVEDHESPYLSKFVDESSDIITLFKAIVNFLTDGSVDITNTGLNKRISRELFGNAELLKGYLDKIGYEKFVNSMISSLDPQFVTSHTFNYVNVYNAHSTPFYILKQGASNYIQIDNRPGILGLSMPPKCIIFHTSSNRRINFGSIIHSVPSDGLRCVFVERKLSMASPFTVPLLEAYMGNFDNIITMQRSTDYGDYKVGPPISVKAGDEKAFVSFNTRSGLETKNMVDAIEEIEQIMPYVPRSVLIGNTNPQCVVELFSKNIFKTDSQLHFFSRGAATPPTPYHINKNTIRAALKIFPDQLKDINPQVRFAITGQSMSYAIGEMHDEKRLDIPTCDPTIGSVFDKSKGSHMVLLVDHGLKSIPNEKPLVWMSGNVADEDGHDTELNKDIIQIKKYGYFAVVAMLNDNPISSTYYKTFNSLMEMINQEVKAFNISENLRFDDYDFKTKSTAKPSAEPPRLTSKDLTKLLPDENIVDVYCNKKYYLITTRGNNAPILKKGVEKAAKMPAFKVTNIELFEVNVQHLKCMSDLSKEGFVQIVEKFVKKCGWMVKGNCFYKELDDRAPPPVRAKVHGFISIRIANEALAQKFALEVQHELSKLVKKEVTVNIPQSVVPMALLEFDDVQEVLREWFKAKGYNVRLYSGQFFVPTEAVARNCIDALLKPGNAPILPRVAIKVDSSVNLNNLQIAIKSSRLSAFLSNKYKCVIAPTGEAAAVRKLVSNLKTVVDEDMLDMDLCEEQEQSSEAINVFDSDGKVVNRHHFCLACTKEMLASATKMFYDETHGIDFKRIMENIIVPVDFGFSNYFSRPDSFFPEAPLGALLYAMCCEPSISSVVKAWVNARVMATIRANPQLVTFCPDHPMHLLIIPSSGNCVCYDPKCGRKLCMVCGSWHAPNEKCDASYGANIKICPYCKFPVDKISGCNHITCRCGKHWCFKCAKAWFNTPSECYKHMSDYHGGCFDYE